MIYIENKRNSLHLCKIFYALCFPKTETEDFTDADLQLFRDAGWWKDSAEERIRFFLIYRAIGSAL